MGDSIFQHAAGSVDGFLDRTIHTEIFFAMQLAGCGEQFDDRLCELYIPPSLRG